MSKLIIANWKSNLNLSQAENWMEEVGKFLQTQANNSKLSDLLIVVAPPFPFIPSLKKKAQQHNIQLAVQDLSAYGAGSYTGAVCSENLKGFETFYAILGHSERRRYFKETVEDVSKKLQQAVQAEINPVLCVDEPYLDEQLQLSQQILLSSKHQKSLIVAYEPLSAIGTGQDQDLAVVEQVSTKIKQFFPDCTVVYGGSVTASNVDKFLDVTDGVLVGGASLEAASFIKMLQTIIE